MEENLIIYVDGLLALHAASRFSAKKSRLKKKKKKKKEEERKKAGKSDTWMD